MATSNSQASPVPLHIVLVVFVDFVFIANAVVVAVSVVFVVFFVDVVFVVMLPGPIQTQLPTFIFQDHPG